MQNSKQPIQSFLDGYPSKGTQYAYRVGVLALLDHIYGKQRAGNTSTKAEFEGYEKLASTYLSEDRDHVKDLIDFISSMNVEKIPPKTANLRACGVRQWFIIHDIAFTEKQRLQMRRVKSKGGRRTNIQYASTKVIGEIIAHGDVRLRALVLVLASSGLRIGEALALTWDQVRIPDRTREQTKLTSLYVSDSKTGLSRTAWITREAEDALMEWRKATPDYLKTVTFKGANLGLSKNTTDKRVFPFGTTSVYVAWDAASKAAGHYTMDEGTHRTQLNVHRLRGFYKTQTMPIVGSEISELLMGHSDAYGNAYTGLPETRLEEEYAKCQDALTIAAVSGRDAIVSSRLEELEKENKELRAKLEAAPSESEIMARVTELLKQKDIEMQNRMAEMIHNLQIANGGAKTEYTGPTYPGQVDEGKLAADAILKQPRGRRGE